MVYPDSPLARSSLVLLLLIVSAGADEPAGYSSDNLEASLVLSTDSHLETSQLKEYKTDVGTFVQIPAGVFDMGGNDDDRDNEMPVTQGADHQALCDRQVRSDASAMAGSDEQQSELFQGGESACGTGELGGCARVHQKVEREERWLFLPVTDRSGVGVCVSGRNERRFCAELG